jgi:hypothetical protein
MLAMVAPALLARTSDAYRIAGRSHVLDRQRTSIGDFRLGGHQVIREDSCLWLASLV